MNIDFLVYKDGQPLKTVSVTLPVIIGRGTGATFTIKHPLLSRKHCEVFEEGGLVQVRDLASLNGTFVDGSRVDSTSTIDSGSQLKLGAVVMDIKYNGILPSEPAPAEHASEGDTVGLDVADMAETEVMTPATEADETASLPAVEAVPPTPDDSGMVDLGDFEVSATAPTEAAPTEAESRPAVDLADFEVNPPSEPSSDEMVDLGDFEVTAAVAEESAVQDRPSLADLAGAEEEPAAAEPAAAEPAAAEPPATSDDPWSLPNTDSNVQPADDDDLDAFLQDLS